MTGRWTLALLAALLAGARPGSAGAQGAAAVDTLTGRVMDRDSTPIASARLSATGDDGRVFRAAADGAGRYRLVIPGGAGRYLLAVQAFGYTPFSVVVERAAGTGRIERDLRLSRRAIPLDTLVARPPAPAGEAPRATPGESRESFGALTLEEFPVDGGDLGALAGLTPGTLRLGGSEDGPALSIAGQAPEQNRVTLDGATHAGGRLPAEGLRGIVTTTSSFDVSQGQFSGGQIAARTVGGTNRWGGALSLRMQDPALQYGAAPGAPGARDRRVLLGGGGGGALLRDRLFVHASADLSRSRGDRPLLDPADAAALGRLGVEADSARRLAAIAAALGIPPGSARGDAGLDLGSALLRIDHTPSARRALTLRLDWRGSRATGLGDSPLRLPGGSAGQRASEGGALARLTSRWGAWSHDLGVHHARGERGPARAAGGPAGQVRVTASEAAGGASAILGFGDAALLPPEEGHSLWEVSHAAVRESANGAHQVKAGFLLQDERASRRARQNAFGTFTFDSLEDLEAGRPAVFTRTLPGEPGTAARRHAAVYAGGQWEAGPGLALVYGVRLEGSRYADRPAPDPRVGADGDVPPYLFLGPRLGFTYDVPGRGGVTVRGGIGAFQGRTPLRLLAAAWNETGAGAAGTRLTCVGAAAPAPRWADYAADPGAIPAACAGSGSPFAEEAPSATVFSSGFAPPRTWRASLGADGSLTPKLTFQASALLARGERLATASDRNLDPAAFPLPSEGGRPVFAAPGEIDPATGRPAPGASRRVAGLGAVREVDARGESLTAQLTAGVVGIVGKKTLFGLSYTLGRSRDRTAGIAAPGGASATTAGDPARLEWAAGDLDRRHALQLIVGNRVHPDLLLSAVGQLGSGLPFTPVVAGDVNADGVLNDRAFVFAPSGAPDAAAAGALAALAEGAPGPVRECLRRQAGRVAERNSCRGPWWSSLDLQAQLTPLGRRSPRGLAVTVTASNVTSGLDYLLHGPRGLRGWGQFPFPDPTLLEVRGFDPAARSYRYRVNPRFGRALAGAPRIPFALTLQARVAVGADPRYQPMERLVAAMVGRAGAPARIRAELAGRVRNVPGAILALDAASPGELGITPGQAERLRAASDSVGPRIEAAIDALAGAFSRRGALTADRRAGVEDAARSALAAAEAGLRAGREILTPAQWSQLPRWLVAPPDADELVRPPPLQLNVPAGL